jgi:nucleotide-binding universal stress UspA family protein
MSAMRTIMVATDFSERSDRALRRAVLLARQSGAAISLVHVVDDDQPPRIVESERGAAEDLLQEQAATLGHVDGVASEARVVLGDAFAGIVRAAEETAADLLVIGPHRRQVLRDVFVGTTAERTIRSATCPVLMANAPPVGPHRHVLMATDLSDASRRVVESVAALGLAGQSRTSLLHVFDEPALRLGMLGAMPTDEKAHYREEARERALQELSAFAASLGAGRMVELVRPDDTTPADAILKTAAEEAADLIVVGTLGRSGLARLFLGSVAAEVLRNADRDVLAVPPRRDG